MHAIYVCHMCVCHMSRSLWFHSSRNPDHAARPAAGSIAQQLHGPALKLILSEDIPTNLPAGTLGAPLDEGKALYKDLQTKYN